MNELEIFLEGLRKIDKVLDSQEKLNDVVIAKLEYFEERIKKLEMLNNAKN